MFPASSFYQLDFHLSFQVLFGVSLLHEVFSAPSRFHSTLFLVLEKLSESVSLWLFLNHCTASHYCFCLICRYSASIAWLWGRAGQRLCLKPLCILKVCAILSLVPVLAQTFSNLQNWPSPPPGHIVYCVDFCCGTLTRHWTAWSTHLSSHGTLWISPRQGPKHSP